MGSPRKDGNTYQLLKPFIEELEQNQVEYEVIWLYDKHIESCIACRKCQDKGSDFGCHYSDDGQEIFDKANESDTIILATPIYSWSCTAPMKALLDRLVCGMNKYYGDEKGPSLWSGKSLGIISTCGYRPEYGAILFEESMKRYCKHSQLNYVGMLAQRDSGYNSVFITQDKIRQAKFFAKKLLNNEEMSKLS